MKQESNEFKEIKHGTDIDVVTKISVLSVFSFRAVLNLGMLLTESEPARQMRSRLLDIVIDVMAEPADCLKFNSMTLSNLLHKFR